MYQKSPGLLLPAIGAGGLLPIGADKILPSGLLPATGVINHNPVLTTVYTVVLGAVTIAAIASSLYVHYKKRHA